MAGFCCLRSDLKRAAQHPEIDRRIIRSGAPLNSIVQQPATTPSAAAPASDGGYLLPGRAQQRAGDILDRAWDRSRSNSLCLRRPNADTTDRVAKPRHGPS